MWIYCADDVGMGMGLGLIVTSLFTKGVFSPFIIYAVSINLNEC
jgi:hypothetical protein